MSEDRTLDSAEVFEIPPISYIYDVDGNKFQIPKRTARVELQVARLAVKHGSQLADRDWGDITFNNIDQASSILRLLPAILEVAPNAIIEASAIILKLDEDEVQDRFSIDQLLKAVSPFFTAIVEALRDALMPIQQQQQEARLRMIQQAAELRKEQEKLQGKDKVAPPPTSEKS